MQSKHEDGKGLISKQIDLLNVNSGNSSGNNTGYKYYNTNTTRLPETVKPDAIKTHTPKYIHYASGTRNAKGGLRIVNEEGAELELPKLPSGNYAIGNEGDQILTKEQTDNINEWAMVTPEEFAASHGIDYKEVIRNACLTHYNAENIARVPETVPERVNNNNINVHYDSLVTVNGDVNDTKHFLNDMKTVADDAIKKSWHDFEMTRKYGMY